MQTKIERERVEIEGGIEIGQLEIRAEEDILRGIKKGNGRERKEVLKHDKSLTLPHIRLDGYSQLACRNLSVVSGV